MRAAPTLIAATRPVVLEPARPSPWRQFDWQLLLWAGLLLGLGILIGFSAAYDDPAVDLLQGRPAKMVIWSLAGVALLLVAATVDYRWLRRIAAPLYALCVAGLLLTAAFGTPLFGARMSISVAGLDVQFSELGKVLVVLVLASHLAGRGSGITALRTIAGAGLLVAIPTALVFGQPDLGTALVYVALWATMLFVAGASLGWLALLAATAVMVVPIAQGLLADYQLARFGCLLDPYADPDGACYQLVQSLNAVGSGGLFGEGLTAGRQNQLGYLPVQSTDFIFTVVAEELGLVGGLVLLALFGLLIWRLVRIGWEAPDPFGRLIPVGVAGMTLFQVVVNIGMATGIAPVTGVPLPFITYGGSSLVSLLLALGICESIRMRSHRPRC